MGTKIIWKAIWHMARSGCLAGIGMGGLYGTLFYPVYGTLVGMLLGGVMGIPLGIITGINIGIMTYGFFYPLRRVWLYRAALAVLSGLITSLAAFLGFSAVFYGPGELYYVVIPTLIATGSAMYASIGFVKVYQQTKRTTEKRKQRKTRLYVAVVLKRLVNAGWKRSISAPRKRTHWQAEEESRSKRAMHSSAQGDSET